MTYSANNEIAQQIIRAIGLNPNDWQSLTLTSRANEPETITLTRYAPDGAGAEIAVTETWRPTEDA